MPRPRRGFSRGNAPSRRLTAWTEGPGGSVPVGLSASGSAILGAGVTPNVEGLTIVRTRGDVEIVLRLAGAAEGFTGAIGLCLVTDEAFAIGITAMPTPVSDMDDELWFYHRFFSLHAGAVTATAALARIALNWEVDSRAMRKQPVGMTCAAVIEVTELPTAIIDVQFDSRQLVKLA